MGADVVTEKCCRWVLLFTALAWPGQALADDVLVVSEVRVDRPTIHALGVQVLITDDDDRDASVEVQYRRVGDADWRPGPPLSRVFPETVFIAVPEQFAGSVFDLEPATEYEIELHAVDPDGTDEVELVMATTRPIPRTDPMAPNPVAVANAAELQSALQGAAPGDVITLAPGTYQGAFFINASGTADNPIVIRGEQVDTVVLDGNACLDCNILEVYGGWVHIEELTFTNAIRALRFQGADTTGNVLRRVTITDVVHGVGSRDGQTDFYVCDNDIEGRLVWPWVYDPNASNNWDDRGVDMNGDGHVICHNRIKGFGDPIVNKTVASRAWDVYGNDIYDSFDGTEIDEASGNVRVYRNRWTNIFAPISIQPIHGGPAYVLRNELFNVVNTQIKLQSIGGNQEPSGALIYHNTFVSPNLALNEQTPITQHNFEIVNNLFVGPAMLVGNRTVDWTAEINQGRFDYNGYFPDGEFWFGSVGGQNRLYSDFADAMASGEVEQNGVLLAEPVFADDFVGPVDGMTEHSPPDFALAAGSNALDVGQDLAGINEGSMGAGPDLGAREAGCAAPSYGPRSAADEAVATPINCGVADSGGDTGGTDTDTGTGTGTSADDSAGTSGPTGGETATAGTESTTAGADGGSDGGGGGGCGCRTDERSQALGAAFLLFAVGFGARRRT